MVPDLQYLADHCAINTTLHDRPAYTSQIRDPGSSPQEVSNLPYLVCSIYRYESVNMSADDAYTPMRRG
jgi:hypothetical protein